MSPAQIVPAMVVALAVGLGVVVAIILATGQTDYARLFPAPDALDWSQGDERVVWLDSNLDGVELRISGLDSSDDPALGLGDILRDVEGTQALPIGRASFGCDDATYAGTDDQGTADVDDDVGYTPFWMDAHSGLGLIACGVTASDADAAVTLYDGTGEELESYAVPVAVAAATPTPAPAPPSWSSTYETRQVCADSTTDRASFLDGTGDTVGAVLPAATGATSYALGLNDPHHHYLFFDLSSSRQLTVNVAGANDTSGIDDNQVYPVVVTARNDTGSDTLVVGIQLDADGTCP